MTDAYLDMYGSLIAPLPFETTARNRDAPACRFRRLRLQRCDLRDFQNEYEGEYQDTKEFEA